MAVEVEEESQALSRSVVVADLGVEVAEDLPAVEEVAAAEYLPAVEESP